jgi:membrane protease YdiL (CAAX protease family)
MNTKSKLLLSLIAFIVLCAASFLIKNTIYARLQIDNNIGIWLFALVLFTITLICLRLDNKKIAYIGLHFSIPNLCYFISGSILAVVFSLIGIVFIGFTIGSSYSINPNFDVIYIIGGLLTSLLPLTIIEELLLRGFAYRKMIDLTNLTITNVVFCITVIVAHWYWWGVWQQPEKMFFATITASGHLMLGYAFLRSKTIYLPIALHLFGNWSPNYLCSTDSPSKAFILIDVSRAVSSVFQLYINFGISVLVNILMMALIYFWFKNKQLRFFIDLYGN